MITEDTYTCVCLCVCVCVCVCISPYKLFSTTDISQIISKVPARKDAVELLMPIKDKWYIIGTVLEVSSADLDSIKYSNNPVHQKLASMISIWLDTHSKHATWEALLKAVEGKIVNSQLTGQKIREFLNIPERSDPHSHSERGRILYNANGK